MMTAFAWVLAVAVTACAGDDARSLLDEYKRRDRTDRHWNDRVQVVTFELHDGGSPRRRTLTFFEKREAGDARKLLVRVSDPPSEQGIGVLLEVRARSAGRQWLYTPRFRKIREISRSAFGRAAIVDSDITHDDLELTTVLPEWGVADAESHRRGRDVVDGETCDVIELTPKGTDVPYKHITIWLGTTSLLVRRLEFSGDGSAPTKRITQRDFRDGDRVPVAYHVTVETLGQKPTSTDITTDKAEFDVGIAERCFDLSTLEDPGKDADACRAASK